LSESGCPGFTGFEDLEDVNIEFYCRSTQPTFSVIKKQFLTTTCLDV